MSDVYNGTSTDSVNPELYKITKVEINKGITAGTNKLKGSVSDIALTNQLRTSAGVFSAFKNHHQTSAIVDLLTDKKGDLVPFSKFKTEALKISNKYNKNWLTTEHNTAKSRAITATNFQRYKEDADLYPNLEWTESRSKDPREAHIQFYGTILPIEHEFWNDNFPGNVWNCKCGIEQTNEKADGKAPTPAIKPPAGLDGNPAFTGEIIASSHPFFKGLNKRAQVEVMKVVRKDFAKDMRVWNKQNINELNGKTFRSKTTQTKSTTLLRGDIKSIVSKISDPFLKTYVTVLEKDIVNWEYLGYSNVIAGKHAEALVFTYYKTNYGGKTLYINSRIDKLFRERPYSIKLNIDQKLIIKKKVPNKYKKKA